MRHADAYERLPDLLGVHPAGGDEVELRRHVDDCPTCRERLEVLRSVADELRRFGDEAPSASLDERVRAIPLAVDPAPFAEQTSPRRRSRPRWIPAAAAAAVVLVVVAFTLALTRGGDSPQRFVAEHTIALASTSPNVHATLAMGKATGSNQPIRLEASGLSSTDAPYYTLWLLDDTHHMMAATFRPEGDGTCIVMGAVPTDMAWTEAAITRSDAPPTHEEMIAVGEF